MISPVTRAMIKIFAYGFYKTHSGLLLFLFVVIFSHIFWMKPLGGHLTPEQSIFYHLIMLVLLANDPVMMSIVFITWLIYTIKSWSYVGKHLQSTENLFLFYSFNSQTKIKQFRSWFFVQLVITLPVITYGISSCIIGLVYHYYTIPFIIPFFLLLLISGSAVVYVKLTNGFIQTGRKSLLLKLTERMKKPFFTLYIGHVLDRMKLTYILTKIFSWAILSGTYTFFSDIKDDPRLSGIAILLVTLTHAFLIFQHPHFEETYLTFARNFPYSRGRRFITFAGVYSILTFPECLWIISHFQPIEASKLLFFALGAVLLFRSFLYLTGLRMYRYLQGIFGIFMLEFLIIMFGYFWILLPLNILLSFWIFYNRYYKY